MHTYKALHEQTPRYLSDRLIVYQPRRTLRSMGSVTLVVQRVRTSSYGERKCQCSATKLWNVLPAHIRESKTLNILRCCWKHINSWAILVFTFFSFFRGQFDISQFSFITQNSMLRNNRNLFLYLFFFLLFIGLCTALLNKL